jgi:site-specific DNA-methyltransferase (adenine-specific)
MLMPTLIIGDCREVMTRFQPQSFHLIVTSPPYNLGIPYPDWNDNLPLDDYFTFGREWLSECYRVLVRGGRLCLNIPFFIHKTHENLLFGYLSVLKEVGFIDREMIVWVKKKHQDNDFVCKQKLFGSVASPSSPHLRSVCEIILIMDKESRRLPGRRQNSDISLPEYEAWTRNVWELDTEGDRRHPTPFPYELPRRLMKLYSYRGNRVLDPFVGRGTTLTVAKQLSRVGVGIELSEAYLPLIQKTVGKGLTVHRIPER